MSDQDTVPQRATAYIMVDRQRSEFIPPIPTDGQLRQWRDWAIMDVEGNDYYASYNDAVNAAWTFADKVGSTSVVVTSYGAMVYYLANPGAMEGLGRYVSKWFWY